MHGCTQQAHVNTFSHAVNMWWKSIGTVINTLRYLCSQSCQSVTGCQTCSILSELEKLRCIPKIKFFTVTPLSIDVEEGKVLEECTQISGRGSAILFVRGFLINIKYVNFQIKMPNEKYLSYFLLSCVFTVNVFNNVQTNRNQATDCCLEAMIKFAGAVNDASFNKRLMTCPQLSSLSWVETNTEF